MDAALFLPLAVGLPLVAALGSFLSPPTKSQAVLHIGVALTQCVLLFACLPSPTAITGMETVRYALGNWEAPLGIALSMDGLSLIMLLTTTSLTLILSIYGTLYLNKKHKAERFWPLWWCLVAGLNGVFVTADIFNVYVTLEIVALASVGLIASSGNRDALTAALRYSLVGLLGSLCYLLGVALLYRIYGTLDFDELRQLAENNRLTGIALAIMTAGLLLKTAVFPLHFWLPTAHANAPTPVSAILSALVVKASLYLLIRLMFDVLSPAAATPALFVIGVMGCGAILWGCFCAIRAQRLKLLVAYSTVAQLGYLCLVFPLAAMANEPLSLSSDALKAVLYFIVAHAFAKAAMFLAAGNIMARYGHDRIQQLRGIARLEPVNLATFVIAGASLIGLPPSAGFIAKWLLLNVAVNLAAVSLIIVVLIGGLLACIYVFRILNLAFIDGDNETLIKHVETSGLRHPGMTLCGFVLALAAMALGFGAEWLLAFLPESNAAIAIDGAVIQGQETFSP